MSNKRIREELRRKEMRSSFYEKYKSKEDLMLNYKTCRAYFKETGCSITDVVFMILKQKYDYPWQAKFIRQATNSARGVRDAEIDIPQFNFKEKVSTILSRFVKDHFYEIMQTWRSGDYPLDVRYIGEEYEKTMAR